MATPKPKRRFPAEPLTEDEVSALLHGCSTRAPTGIRNRALITVMYRSGLRISEALDLRAADIDVKAGSIRVLDGKGHKPRTVGIDDGGIAIVQRWIDTRRALGFRNGPLFCTLKGKRVSDRYVRDMLKRLRAKAELEKRIHPHGLRHSYATELVHEGTPLNQISKALGHANSAITAHYLDHVAPADVIAMGRKRPVWNPDQPGTSKEAS